MESSARAPHGPAGGNTRFDGESVRRILQRAAVEQHRLDTELTDTYSRAELEEMAAEARISQAALRAALAADADGHSRESGGRVQDRMAPGYARLLGRWSPSLTRAALAAAACVTVVALLSLFPVAAAVLFWTTVIAFVLILLGASPF